MVGWASVISTPNLFTPEQQNKLLCMSDEEIEIARKLTNHLVHLSSHSYYRAIDGYKISDIHPAVRPYVSLAIESAYWGEYGLIKDAFGSQLFEILSELKIIDNEIYTIFSSRILLDMFMEIGFETNPGLLRVFRASIAKFDALHQNLISGFGIRKRTASHNESKDLAENQLLADYDGINESIVEPEIESYPSIAIASGQDITTMINTSTATISMSTHRKMRENKYALHYGGGT